MEAERAGLRRTQDLVLGAADSKRQLSRPFDQPSEALAVLWHGTNTGVSGDACDGGED